MTTEWKMVPVEPTEEMMNAAEVAWKNRIRDKATGKRRLIDNPRISFLGTYRAMLSAAPEAPAPAPVVGVKPLEWVNRHREPQRENDLIARSVVGTYEIRPSADGLKFRLFVPGGIYHEAPEFKSVEVAKSAAQADHERRIRSALDIAPAPSPDAIAAARAEGQREGWNEAVREAAMASTTFLIGDPINGVPFSNSAPRGIYHRILSLLKEGGR